MNRVYFSDVKKNETWEEAETLTYIIIPRKWWSIKQWSFANNFSKSVKIFFMKVV